MSDDFYVEREQYDNVIRERDQLRALCLRAQQFIENVPTDAQLDAKMANGDTGRRIWGELELWESGGR